MKCSKCKRLLIEFSDGRLADELNQEVKKHISDCGACRQELYGLRSSLKLLDDARDLEGTPDPPGDFAENVMNRIHRNNAGHFAFRRLVFGTIAVCCLLGLGATLFFYGDMEKQSLAPAPDNTMIVEIEAPTNILSVEHMKKELVRMLDQTLEAIERGEQEWEVEI